MKDKYSLSLITAAALALVGIRATLGAAHMDSAIEASAKQSFVFNHVLKGDDVEVESENGVVTLTGTVSEYSKKSLAEETVAALPEVKRVENKLGIKAGPVRPVAPTPPSRLRVVGVVTPTRQAASGAEEALATKRASGGNGVQSVNDKTVK